MFSGCQSSCVYVNVFRLACPLLVVQFVYLNYELATMKVC